MLRDERQTALNDVVVACKDVADGYDDAANSIDDSILSDLFRDYGRRRHDTAVELEGHVRRLGDLPRDPDADAETVQRLFTHLKAAFSDERSALLQAREEAEIELGRLIAIALEKDLPEDTKAVLRQLGDSASEAAQRLAGARAKP